MPDKPKAYRSPLWDHLQELIQWRKERLTWQEIAQKLYELHQIKITYQSVQAFFDRATDPKRRRKRPLGFEAREDPPLPSPSSGAVAAAPPPPAQGPQTPTPKPTPEEAAAEFNRRCEQRRQQQQQQKFPLYQDDEP